MPFSNITWNGSYYLAVGIYRDYEYGGEYGDISYFYSSPDGITWTETASWQDAWLPGLTWGGDLFVAVGESATYFGEWYFTNYILTSPDGVTWTRRDSWEYMSLRDVTWSGSQFVAVGINGVIVTSGAPPAYNVTEKLQTFLKENYPGSFVAASFTGEIDQGQTTGPIGYTAPGGVDLTFLLGWAGSELKLSIYNPEGSLYQEMQSQDSPIVMEVKEAAAGEWTFTVTGVDVPMDGYPYAVLVGQEKPISRIAGSNRYTTAVDVSRKGWPEEADTVLLARGDNFPDSLAGVSLAYQLNAPILLTPTNSLHSQTKAEIERLGASRVIILGGTGAISAAVEAALLAIDTVDTVDRLGGANRYETAKMIAEELDKGSSFDTAFLAFGLGFPDALAAASYGALDGYPILLTGKDSLPKATADALDKLSSIQNIVIVGGEAVISSVVENELLTRGLTVQRIMGNNRYETAVELAKAYMPTDAGEVFIATGLNFPDALAGGVLAAKRNSGVLLVRGDRATLPASLVAFIGDNDISRVTILGGTAAVSEGIEQSLTELLE